MLLVLELPRCDTIWHNHSPDHSPDGASPDEPDQPLGSWDISPKRDLSVLNSWVDRDSF